MAFVEVVLVQGLLRPFPLRTKWPSSKNLTVVVIYFQRRINPGCKINNLPKWLFFFPDRPFQICNSMIYVVNIWFKIRMNVFIEIFLLNIHVYQYLFENCKIAQNTLCVIPNLFDFRWLMKFCHFVTLRRWETRNLISKEAFFTGLESLYF